MGTCASLLAEDERGYLQPLAQGPQNSMPAKRKPKAKPKRSQRLKAMLGPPESVGEQEATSVVPVRVSRLEDLMPGLPAKSEEPAFLHCAMSRSEDDLRCLAPLARGGRCKRKRTAGNYCRQHGLEWAGKDKQQQMWQSLQGTWQDASATCCCVRRLFSEATPLSLCL